MQYFGTDGIRGKEGIFTPDFLTRIARATVGLKERPKVVIGRDPRVSGERIEGVLTGTLLRFGAEVLSAGMTPTPVLAFLTRHFNADFGIMISASHNPPEYNGIKFLKTDGRKIEESTEAALERLIDNPCALEEREGVLTRIEGNRLYIDDLCRKLQPSVAGMRILMDTANGATAEIAPQLFRELGCDVTAIYTETDGVRINENCGATHIETLAEAMRKGSYDLGFSFDGDGDRLMAAVGGRILDGDHILYIVARVLQQQGTLKDNTVVGTVMTNLGTEKSAAKHGIRLIRTKVGDKYVSDEMERNGYAAGGETSGHLIFSAYHTTGDGILAALLLAVIERKYGVLNLDDLEEYPQSHQDILTDADGIAAFDRSEAIKSYLRKVEGEIDGRIVVRKSGTEPKIRIMAEGKTKAESEAIAREIRTFILEQIKQ